MRTAAGDSAYTTAVPQVERIPGFILSVHNILPVPAHARAELAAGAGGGRQEGGAEPAGGGGGGCGGRTVGQTGAGAVQSGCILHFTRFYNNKKHI